MKIKVGIVGSTGYTGNELIRILHEHPHVELTSLATSSALGKYVHHIYPHLKGCIDKRYTPFNIKEMAQTCDIVFLAVLAERSLDLVPKFLDYDTKRRLRLIDLSDAYRSFQETKNFVKAVYGLPECNRSQIQEAFLIANPGCMATCALIALLPLLQEECVQFPIFVNAFTGTSGAGKTPHIESLCAEQKNGLRPYRIHNHRHKREVEHVVTCFLKQKPKVLFNAISTEMVRGILCISNVILSRPFSKKALLSLYKSFYREEPFVRFFSNQATSHHQYPNPKLVIGSNYCDIALAVDEESHSVTLISALDNLVKGAAGQAVQNMNILFGLEETCGLTAAPLYPA